MFKYSYFLVTFFSFISTEREESNQRREATLSPAGGKLGQALAGTVRLIDEPAHQLNHLKRKRGSGR